MSQRELLYRSESYTVLGALLEVYAEKGCGFLEGVYQRCLEIELGLRGVPFRAQPQLSLTYKGRPLELPYRPDFVCYGKIIIEIKAMHSLADEHRAQVQNYLRATGMRLAFLANFGHYPGLEHERIVL